MDISRRGLLGGAVAGTMLGVLPTAQAQQPGIDWPRFLGACDMVWQRVPRAWYEGPFLGNGFLAAAVYREPGANAIRITVDHSQVQDHRPQFGNEWGVARLPVGKLLLTPKGTITGVDMRLELWNAELTGTIKTDQGDIAIRLFVHAETDLLCLEVHGDHTLVFEPAEALSPRTIREPPPATFPRNPKPITKTERDMTVVVQPMVAGGQTATAYRKRGNTLLLSVKHTYPGTTAESQVRDIVRFARPERLLRQEHQNWWHAFYRKSFLSIPDELLQSFYWIQLYKIASASRQSGPIMATTGPWIEPTPWPSLWNNLNVQLEYWLAYGSNHLELDPIPRTIQATQRILVDALRPQFRGDSMGVRRSTDAQFDDAGFVGAPGFSSPDPEIGNLPWILHNVWLNYRHSMDPAILDILFPTLRRAMNYYLHFLSTGMDGRLHLAPTFSPEYGTAPDCNFDLALIRWCCRTLLEIKPDDPLAPKWREVLSTLVDYPVDANGFMVGTGVPFAKSHRHYSHMLAVYPLYLVSAETGQRELIEKSLKHWISFEGALRGYSFTGASSISAGLGHGDDALKYLREFVARFAQANTMYFEAGPVIETPLSGAQSLHDMLCQSWGGVIRIFPAVPSTWRDVALQNFRTEGAFLVTASKKDGRTEFVRVRSLAGQPLKLRTDIQNPEVRGARTWHREADGTLVIDFDHEVLIHQAGARPDLTIKPVPISTPAKPWGLPALPNLPTLTVDLAAALNNDGFTNEFQMNDGDFDGAGNTYPAAQLPQTGHAEDDGIPFEFVNGNEGAPNNIIPAGQTIQLPPGKYPTMHLLAASDNGNTNTKLTVTYADGTAQVPLQITDWRASPAFGETEALRTRQMHTRTGPAETRLSIFHQKVPLDPARELLSITLPAAAKPRPHIFAITLQKP
ncbi:Tat pathway signal sequence domain protein [Kibdelosporangium aridum]|uniref:Tat pathway signal sequence domain protein n=1 Tax=Kibdelosporangium aridum TaxID=2030 RepID=A0A428Z1R9_KIBAR|nr:Tat pathway signal sequence domain protein [Kibdelosporangium aridum]RSM78985.1 Tat pathway signal sequence domain protein [Kibdelosporangium aridum]